MADALSGNVVVITGASTGIGRATSLYLARQGAIVVLAARESAYLRELEREITRGGGRALALPTDVAHYDQVLSLAQTTVERFGRIDAWVNNAAQSLYATVEHTDVEEFRHIMEVNFMGQVHGTKAVLPILRRQGHGIIVHVSSLEAAAQVPLQAAYASSKAALVAFASVARQELRGTGVHVCTVLPASIDTPLFDHARTKEGRKPQTLPPIYSPFVVARAIAACLRHPRREVVAGAVGRFSLPLARLAPGVVESFTSRFAAPAQLTTIPEGPTDDNFDRPIAVPDPLTGCLVAAAPWKGATFLNRLALSLLALSLAAAGISAANRHRGRPGPSLPM